MTPEGAKVNQVQDDSMSGIEGQMVYTHSYHSFSPISTEEYHVEWLTRSL